MFGASRECELLTMARPRDPPTVARMDSLSQLEYIIERERYHSIGPQPQPSDAAQVPTASPLSGYLRRIFDVQFTPPRNRSKCLRWFPSSVKG
jgi:hypothetical protein